MNLHHQGRLLYISLVDVSQPTGPGVNEREFLLSLLGKFGPRVRALIPRPESACPEAKADQVVLYGSSSLGNPVGFICQQCRLKSRIRKLLSQEPFDFAVVRLGFMPLGLYLSRAMMAPYAVKTVGNVTRGLADRRGWRGLFSKPLAQLNSFLVRSILQRACGIDACTEILLRRHATELGLPPSRLLLCGNATNIERFVPRNTREARASLGISHLAPVLGYVGGRPAERGGMAMLAVAARIKDAYPRLGVVIVGGDEKPLLKRARELGLEHRVVIPGKLPYEQIPTYVNAFDVCFALDRPDRIQQVGNSHQKIRQYLACGKRVLASVSPDSFLVREGLVGAVDPENLESMEMATRTFLNWDEARERRHAAKSAAYARQHLSTEVALNRRVDFWNECLRRVRFEDQSSSADVAAERGRQRVAA